MLLYINVPRIFLDGCIRPRGTAMQGPHGPHSLKDPLLLLLWGPACSRGHKLGWLVLVRAPNTSKSAHLAAGSLMHPEKIHHGDSA